MAQAGTVEIDFAAETAKFRSEVKVMRGELNRLRDDVGTITGYFKKAGSAVRGVFGGAIVGGLFREIVSGSDEAERTFAQLTSTLKSTHGAVGITAASLVGLADSAQLASRFSNDAVISMQSILLTFTRIKGPEFEGAQQAILDIATKLGTDLKGAAIQVGKALNDPVKGVSALAEVGVSFTESQRRLILKLTEAGETAEAQKVILKELAVEFGGAAAAARDTFGGALTGVKNAFGDLLESRDGMPAATKAINELAVTMASPQFKDGFQAIITGLAKVVELTAKGAANLIQFNGRLADSIVFGANSARSASQNATQSLQAELRDAEARASQMERLIARDLVTQDELRTQRQYIETLKERIKLAAELQPKRDFLAQVPAAADSIIDQITAPTAPADPEDQFASLAQQQAFQKFIASNQKDIADTLAKNREDERNREMAETANYGQEVLAALQLQLNAEAEMRNAYHAQVLEDQIKADEDVLQAAIQFEETKREMYAQTGQLAVGLLQQLAQKSKVAAVALILVNRGLQIAQATQNTAAAVTNALANVPYPYNLAAAAQIETIGAVQIGIIAATGALEVGQVAKGNSASVVGPGTPNNPIFTQGQDDGAAQGASSKAAVEIHVHGNVFSSQETADWIINEIANAVTDRDVVFIDSNSRQGQELKP